MGKAAIVAPVQLTEVEKITKTLENRQKRLECISKVQLIKAEKIKFDQESEERELKNEKLQLENAKLRSKDGYLSPAIELCLLAQSCIIDDEKTLPGSEMKLKSMWTPTELKVIKKQIDREDKKDVMIWILKVILLIPCYIVTIFQILYNGSREILTDDEIDWELAITKLIKWDGSFKKKEECSASDDVDSVHKVLTWTKESGLEIEVITWALYAMKKNPKLTIWEAMMSGYDEWVK